MSCLSSTQTSIRYRSQHSEAAVLYQLLCPQLMLKENYDSSNIRYTTGDLYERDSHEDE
jgi:hypothetical protein